MGISKNNVLFITVMLTGLLVPALYAGAGAGGAAFLKIDAGARAAAMGGAFTAVADDASSVFYNPAGPALLRRKEIMLAHNEWLEGLRNEHAAYVHPVSPRLTLFTGFTALIAPSLSGYDKAGEETGNFSAMDGMGGAGLAWALDGDSFFGLFIKTVYQRADNRHASAYAGDAGFIKNYGKNLRLGAAAQNLGTPIRLYEERFALPRTYRGGGAYRIVDRLWVSAEAVKAGASDVMFAAGAEGDLDGSCYARFGYKTGRARYAGPGFSAGVGIREGTTAVDYAFTPFGDLGSTHRLTLSFRFGEDRRKFAPVPALKRAYRAGKAPAPGQKRGSRDKGRKPAPADKGDNPVNLVW